MDILCETHVPRKYRRALEAEPWATVRVTTEFLPAEASDGQIAEFAAENDYVLFVRDEDFFEVAKQSDVGVLYLYQLRDPSPATLVAAINSIREFYSDHSGILESIPGNWA